MVETLPDPATLPTTLPGTLATAPNPLIGQYTTAEQALIAQSAAAVSRYINSAQTPTDAARLYTSLQQVTKAVAAELTRNIGPMVDELVSIAARSGSANAVREVRKALTGHPDLMDVYTKPMGEAVTAHGLHAADLIGQDLKSKLDMTQARITRFPTDVYQKVTAQAAITQVTGTVPVEAQKQAWQSLTDNGIDGYTDAKGREWNLASYTEMAVRSATIRAFNASHLDRMQSLNIEYYTVDTTGHPCGLCMPWEGKVLTVGNPDVSSVLPDTGDDGAVSVHVDATVDEAIAAGLQHPNCKHVLVAFFPGVTQIEPRTPESIEQGLEEYRQAQYLRGLERAVRQAKLDELGALDDTDRSLAQQRVRALQARIRDYTAQTGLMRRPRREQLNLGNGAGT